MELKFPIALEASNVDGRPNKQYRGTFRASVNINNHNIGTDNRMSELNVYFNMLRAVWGWNVPFDLHETVFDGLPDHILIIISELYLVAIYNLVAIWICTVCALIWKLLLVFNIGSFWKELWNTWNRVEWIVVETSDKNFSNIYWSFCFS